MPTMTRFGSQGPKWWLVQVICGVLLLWPQEMDGLSDFSKYLSQIIISHSAHACDGEQLRLQCPRHSTVSIQSAFYGPPEARLCTRGPETALRDKGDNGSCSVFTALQKLLSECQGHRRCHVPVNHHVFGRDPCPGTLKYLQVSYKCKPTEHKMKVGCEGERMTLHCKHPRVLNMYSAVYGRGLEEEDACAAHEKQPPPFECLYYGAVHIMSRLCYGKQRCFITIDEQNFRDPCPPGTTKYLTVLYSCVPQTLLREADPNVPTPTSDPTLTTGEGEPRYPKGSRLPDNHGIIVSNSLMAYGYITEHPEMAALLFTSSVCVGLLVALLAVSATLSCSGPRHGGGQPSNTRVPSREEEPREEEEEEDEDEDEEDEMMMMMMDSPLLSEVDRKQAYCWEEVAYTTEAAEMMERIERRELVIQEIWMNAYLNGASHAPR